MYLAEHRQTRQEVVLKSVNCKRGYADFLREYHNSYLLSSHAHVITVYDVLFRLDTSCMFAVEYAPFGDLTSNLCNGTGIGEHCSKLVAKQIGSALDWVHSKSLCHSDVKLDNILVFRSDFSVVKLCDFGSIHSQGDIVIKKTELMSYCPPELFAKHTNEYYQVDWPQDTFQFGVVVYYCLLGVLPWQRADLAADPNFAEFNDWIGQRSLLRSGAKVPKNFKAMTTRGQKLFRKLLDPDPTRRMRLGDLAKYTEDNNKWLRSKTPRSSSLGLGAVAAAIAAVTTTNPEEEVKVPLPLPAALNQDGVSQLTMGSFQSVHSNAIEKNRVLYSLLQCGVETTVDRSQKNSRIINWIQHGQPNDPNDLSTTSKHEEEDAVSNITTPSSETF